MTAPAPDSNARPVLIYDGDCDFCAYWARYWQRLTGDRVRYRPYQEAAPDYPEITVDAFQRAIQYIGADGKVASAAEAAFRTLAQAPGEGVWTALYRRLPGFAAASEAAYASIARHRPLFFRLSRLAWGPEREPARHEITTGLFLRAVGLVYLAAFVSLAVQITALMGSHGILPAATYLPALERSLGSSAWLSRPSLFWLSASDTALIAACWAGAGTSLLVIANRFSGAALLILFVLYLSLYHVGQVFLEYQWDLLLLETGFLAWLLTSGSRIPLWLLRWLLFRFMFLSGAVKLASGDPAWTSLKALDYHFETQPLPTPLAWYAHQLPEDVRAFLVAAHFVIELVLPFLIFLPRRFRLVAAAGFLVLQLFILATGNYGFFNLIVLALTLLLLDDQLLHRVLPDRFAATLSPRTGGAPRRKMTIALSLFAALSVTVGTLQMAKRIELSPDATVFAPATALRVVNPYGVFAHMIRDRREVVVEGSHDGVDWRAYVFRYEPGPVERAPPRNVPHQPRLDWQMWFTALREARENPWFVAFLRRLLEGSGDVTKLLGDNPFVGQAPRFVRATLYRYRFATPSERASGLWWVREPEREYFPAVTLDTIDQARRSGPVESLIRWR
jgi:predicted DCC family thiol-disulfide oxidoreductase YuxK